MKLIVGLGNPGILYAGTRHNIGFEVIKRLARAKKVVLRKERGIKALAGRCRKDGGSVVLAMPLTFMNLSGEAVKQLLRRYEADLADLLVVCDDLDLELSRIKIRPSGSSAGQRGVKSVIDSLKSDKFARLRVGIGRPREGIEPADFVLKRFNRREKESVSRAIEDAMSCCSLWAEEGIEKAMNIYNRKDTKE